MSKTAEVDNEEALVKALSDSSEPTHAALLDSLVARADYETFVETMKAKRTKELHKFMGRMEDATEAAQAAKKK